MDGWYSRVTDHATASVREKQISGGAENENPGEFEVKESERLGNSPPFRNKEAADGLKESPIRACFHSLQCRDDTNCTATVIHV